MARPSNNFSAVNDLDLSGRVLRGTDWRWSSEVQYEIDDVTVGSNDTWYICILQADNQDPTVEDSTFWRTLSADSGSGVFFQTADIMPATPDEYTDTGATFASGSASATALLILGTAPATNFLVAPGEGVINDRFQINHALIDSDLADPGNPRFREDLGVITYVIDPTRTDANDGVIFFGRTGVPGEEGLGLLTSLPTQLRDVIVRSAVGLPTIPAVLEPVTQITGPPVSAFDEGVLNIATYSLDDFDNASRTLTLRDSNDVLDSVVIPTVTYETAPEMPSQTAEFLDTGATFASPGGSGAGATALLILGTGPLGDLIQATGPGIVNDRFQINHALADSDLASPGNPRFREDLGLIVYLVSSIAPTNQRVINFGRIGVAGEEGLGLLEGGFPTQLRDVIVRSSTGDPIPAVLEPITQIAGPPLSSFVDGVLTLPNLPLVPEIDRDTTVDYMLRVTDVLNEETSEWVVVDAASTTLTGLSDVPDPTEAQITATNVLKLSGGTPAAPTYAWLPDDNEDGVTYSLDDFDEATRTLTLRDSNGVLDSVVIPAGAAGDDSVLMLADIPDGVATRQELSVVLDNGVTYFIRSDSYMPADLILPSVNRNFNIGDTVPATFSYQFAATGGTTPYLYATSAGNIEDRLGTLIVQGSTIDTRMSTVRGIAATVTVTDAQTPAASAMGDATYNIFDNRQFTMTGGGDFSRFTTGNWIGLFSIVNVPNSIPTFVTAFAGSSITRDSASIPYASLSPGNNTVTTRIVESRAGFEARTLNSTQTVNLFTPFFYRTGAQPTSLAGLTSSTFAIRASQDITFAGNDGDRIFLVTTATSVVFATASSMTQGVLLPDRIVAPDSGNRMVTFNVFRGPALAPMSRFFTITT